MACFHVMTYCALLFLFTCYRLAHVEEEVVGRAGRGVIISRSGGGGGGDEQGVQKECDLAAHGDVGVYYFGVSICMCLVTRFCAPSSETFRASQPSASRSCSTAGLECFTRLDRA